MRATSLHVERLLLSSGSAGLRPWAGGGGRVVRSLVSVDLLALDQEGLWTIDHYQTQQQQQPQEERTHHHQQQQPGGSARGGYITLPPLSQHGGGLVGQVRQAGRQAHAWQAAGQTQARGRPFVCDGRRGLLACLLACVAGGARWWSWRVWRSCAGAGRRGRPQLLARARPGRGAAMADIRCYCHGPAAGRGGGGHGQQQEEEREELAPRWAPVEEEEEAAR